MPSKEKVYQSYIKNFENIRDDKVTSLREKQIREKERKKSR